MCKFLALKAHLEFLEEWDAYHLSSHSLNLLKPAPHWAVTVGDVKMTRLNNFRIRLLVGCDGLERMLPDLEPGTPVVESMTHPASFVV